ncbi:hypothetical protein K443DRAFT_253970 [Laccaria amethystina LaAM-08-1]|uniref:Uncharacterized protein n=1 Tax=Laccaria amethystina LaAM-08-1 TaxID=1095629 RepID=A0A0C9XIE4_9AGAR|nr:hypothetical protein K443DRAFT_253970 [Laccaria amethystina LaAM-08-1]
MCNCEISQKSFGIDGKYAQACLAHIYHICSSILIPSKQKGRYSTALIPNATSKPISPVVLAIGPVNHTWLIQGMPSPNEAIPAARAAMPEGNLLGTSQSSRSYSAGLLCRITRCSRMIIAMNALAQYLISPRKLVIVS